MLKAALKYLPVIASVLLWFIDADKLFRLLFWPFTSMDTLALVPQVLNTEQRFSLFGLWLGGSLYFLALMWVAVTRRNKVYLSVAVALAVFVTGISLFSMPFGEQSQRRWQSMNQLALPAWDVFLLNRQTQFDFITQRTPYDEQAIIAGFTKQTDPLRQLPLGWNEDDAAAVDALWQQALGNREQEAQALSKMADYLRWMPDYAPLALASAILTLTTDDNKMRAQAAFRRAIAVAPEDPDAWFGWALAQIQSHDSPSVHRRGNLQAQSIATGLLMAEWLKDKTRHPALAQRLADYIEQMPQDDRQILRILQAREQTRRYEVPPAEHIRALADEVLPLRRAMVDKNSMRGHTVTNPRFPGHVVIAAEKYGIVKASLPELRYPNVARYIKSATTLLSLDISASGELLSILVEHSSGVAIFDRAAAAYSALGRFQPAAEGRRVLIPVTFISDRPDPQEHYQDMEARAIRIARLAARHNKAVMEATAQEMVDRFEKMNRFFVQKPVSREDLRELQNLYFKKGNSTPEARSKTLKEVAQMMVKLSEKYPYDVLFLKHQARLNGKYTFEEKRAKWAKILALAPHDPHAWVEWGSLWSDADPELYMGAFIYGSVLLASDPDSNQKIAPIQNSLMMRLDMDEREQILSARAWTGYADIVGQRVVDANEYAADKARNILPASKMLSRHENVLTTDPQGNMTVDVNRKAIVSAPLSGVPLLEAPVQGTKRTELTVDTDKNGLPTLVLVSKSSLVEEYDAQAVNMVWGWTFKPHPGGRQITVGVNFSR